MSSQRAALTIPVSIAVLVGWLSALGYSLITAQYTPLTIVTPVMLLLAGYVFGVSIVGGGDKNGHKPKEKE